LDQREILLYKGIPEIFENFNETPWTPSSLLLPLARSAPLPPLPPAQYTPLGRCCAAAAAPPPASPHLHASPRHLPAACCSSAGRPCACHDRQEHCSAASSPPPWQGPERPLSASFLLSITFSSSLWQNQPELHRLKYASPLLRATSCFKRYNPIGLSGNVPINHRTQDPTRYLTRR
jgi:hypothetical protein